MAKRKYKKRKTTKATKKRASKIDLTITKKPIINKIKQPINSVINSGKKSNNILPKKTDIKETSSEIINKIIVLKKEIFLSECNFNY